MRTTLDLPESLLSEVMEVAQVKTRTKVITLALQELIRKRNTAKLKTYKSKVGLKIDMDPIRGRC